MVHLKKSPGYISSGNYWKYYPGDLTFLLASAFTGSTLIAIHGAYTFAFMASRTFVSITCSTAECKYT
jgi:hypothetical protein